MTAVYARQSIDKKDSISIETQIEYSKHEVFNDEIRLYTDRGYSGKNTNRPAYEQMMKDIEAGEINKVAVYRIDRISRSIVDFADFINKLENKKTAFVSATEKFDTSSPMGRAMLYIIIVFAQLERETISLRLHDNYYARIKNGAIGGGPAPFGFDTIRKKINGINSSVLCPNENIAFAKKIFDIYAQPGTSLADVQSMLMENNILTSTGKPWTNAKLSGILKSPCYVKADADIYSYYKAMGAVPISPKISFDGIKAAVLAGKRSANSRKYTDVSNHVLAVASHNGIIDSQTFLYIQNKLNSNMQIKNLHKGKYSWLTGYVKCGSCGYAFTVRKSMCAQGSVNYFVCSGKYLYKSCFVKQTHRVEEVEKCVETELVKYIKTYDFGPFESTEKINCDLYHSKISEIDLKINNLVSSLEKSSPVAAEYINKRIENLDNEKKILVAKSNTEIIHKIPDKNYIDFDNLSFENKKQLAAILIDKVILLGEDIKIVWK